MGISLLIFRDLAFAMEGIKPLKFNLYKKFGKLSKRASCTAVIHGGQWEIISMMPGLFVKAAVLTARESPVLSSPLDF
jgi:hypothetical protein